jgi:hypothetical protein
VLKPVSPVSGEVLESRSCTQSVRAVNKRSQYPAGVRFLPTHGVLVQCAPRTPAKFDTFRIENRSGRGVCETKGMSCKSNFLGNVSGAYWVYPFTNGHQFVYVVRYKVEPLLILRFEKFKLT